VVYHQPSLRPLFERCLTHVLFARIVPVAVPRVTTAFPLVMVMFTKKFSSPSTVLSAQICTFAPLDDELKAGIVHVPLLTTT